VPLKGLDVLLPTTYNYNYSFFVVVAAAAVVNVELVDVSGCRAGTILGSLLSKYSSLTRRDHHHRLPPRMINTFNKDYKYKEVLMVQANRFTTQA
jgi:hypothetical protein